MARGDPRVQYDRIYILLPPTADREWALAAVDASWQFRRTIGGSADDAGVGNLDRRKVIAVNPEAWGRATTAMAWRVSSRRTTREWSSSRWQPARPRRSGAT